MISNLRKLCLSYDLVEDIGEIVCEKGIIAPGKAVKLRYLVFKSYNILLY